MHLYHYACNCVKKKEYIYELISICKNTPPKDTSKENFQIMYRKLWLTDNFFFFKI